MRQIEAAKFSAVIKKVHMKTWVTRMVGWRLVERGWRKILRLWNWLTTFPLGSNRCHLVKGVGELDVGPTDFCIRHSTHHCFAANQKLFRRKTNCQVLTQRTNSRKLSERPKPRLARKVSNLQIWPIYSHSNSHGVTWLLIPNLENQGAAQR